MLNEIFAFSTMGKSGSFWCAIVFTSEVNRNWKIRLETEKNTFACVINDVFLIILHEYLIS